MPVFPGNSATKFNQVKTLANDSYNNYELKINMHAGTHIDQLLKYKSFEIVALPLNIKADSSIARVVARVII